MDHANDRGVLWCTQCNKPFTKHAALKRHGYYCRSRRAGASVRPRSCLSCARGKVGCDNKRPSCLRCINRGVHCQYPSGTAGSTARQGANPAPLDPGSDRDPSLTDVAETPAADGVDMTLDGALALLHPDFPTSGVEYPRWDYGEMGLTDFVNPQSGGPLSTQSSSLPRRSTPLTPPGVRLQHAFVPPGFHIPPSPTDAVRSLVQRPKTTAGARRIADLILSTLRSYPLMLRGRSPPPFIHPKLLSPDMEEAATEPLMNCISLMHMIGSGVRGSRKLFWENVRRECERLTENYRDLGKWGLLAAMQALFLYVLIRLDEGETEHNNLDSLLVKAVILVAQQISRSELVCHTQCALCNNGLDIGWDEWLFKESRRRLAIAYRVVNKLVYFQPASMCDMPEEFILAPLPAKRQLWEASDETSWRAESQKDPHAHTSYGLAADGEIVKLDEGRLSCNDAWLPCSPRSDDSHGSGTDSASTCWQEWCTGIDGFGGLVILAASLIV